MDLLRKIWESVGNSRPAELRQQPLRVVNGAPPAAKKIPPVIKPRARAGRLIEFPDIGNQATKKGYLTSSFLKGVLLGGGAYMAAKYAVKSSIRSMDLTMGVGSALAGGAVSVGIDMLRDFNAARKNPLLGKKTLDAKGALKHIWQQNSRIYTKKFVVGTVGGLAGAWGVDWMIENPDTIKEWFKSGKEWAEPGTTWISDRWKEWAPQPLRDLTAGLGAWLGEKYAGLREKWTDIKDRVMTSFGSQTQAPSLPEDLPALPLFHPPLGTIPESMIQSLEIPAPPAPIEAIEEIVTTEAAPQEIIEITDIELTPTQQFAAILDTSEPGSRPDYIVTKALQGTAWAQNEAIDGLYNGRFGFAQNRELAVKLAAEMAEPIKERLAALGPESLLEGEKKLLLNHAFMEHNIGHNPEGARDIVAKLGQSWYGAPELAPQLAEEFADAGDPAPLIEENFTPQQIAEMPDLISCTAGQNPADMSSAFEVACQPADARLKPGDAFSLTIKSGGEPKILKAVIGDEILKTSPQEYLGEKISSLLEAVREEPEPTPALVAAH